MSTEPPMIPTPIEVETVSVFLKVEVVLVVEPREVALVY